jgi:hypothetical protein
MEVVGKIIQVLPEQGGVSKTSGKDWKLQAYVLETLEQYPKKVHFEVFGEDRIKANPCQLDDIVTVSFDIESREFNGRWYTSIRAWRVVIGDVTNAIQTNQDGTEENNTDVLSNMLDANEMRKVEENNNGNLPF